MHTHTYIHRHTQNTSQNVYSTYLATSKGKKNIKQTKGKAGLTCLTSACWFSCLRKGGKTDNVSLREHCLQIGMPGSHQGGWGQVDLVQNYHHITLQFFSQIAVQTGGQVQGLNQPTKRNKVTVQFLSQVTVQAAWGGGVGGGEGGSPCSFKA